MILNDVYNHFYQKCNEATSLVRISNLFFDNQVQFVGETYSTNINRCVINGSFLMMFTALEEFLEQSFICYMIGQLGLNNRPVLSYVNPPSEEHARAILKGRDKYPDFTNCGTILSLAHNFFENGGTFVVLNNFKVAFEEAKKIRNAITHISKESQQKFSAIVREKLGALPHGCDTSTFLNTFETGTNNSYFIHYREFMKLIVDGIANP